MENPGIPVAVHKLYRVPLHHLHSNYGKNSYSYSLIILQNTEKLSMRKNMHKKTYLHHTNHPIHEPEFDNSG